VQMYYIASYEINYRLLSQPRSGVEITCEINKGNMQDVDHQLKSEQLATELTSTDIIESVLRESDPNYCFQTTRENDIPKM